MHFEEDYFMTNAPLFSVIIVIILVSYKILIKLWNGWPIEVNCWFCNNYLKVKRKELDWWKCIFCEQYNGFSKDGDYSYEIPEQYANQTEKTDNNASYCKQNKSLKKDNGLCPQCNDTEELKLLELRKMEDLLNDFSDKEIEKIKMKCEKMYPLCSNCENNLKRVLHSQSLWLTEYKMLIFRKRPIRRLLKDREKIGKTLRIVLSIVAPAAIYYSNDVSISLFGLLLQVISYFTCIRRVWNSDILPFFCWIMLVSLQGNVSANSSNISLQNIENEWSANLNAYKYFITTLGIVIVTSNWCSSQTRNNINPGSLSFKKLSTLRKVSTSELAESEHFLPVKTEGTSETCKDVKRYSPVNITENLMSPIFIQCPTPTKVVESSEWCYKEHSTPTNYFSCKQYSYPLECEITPPKNLKNQNVTLSESLESLNSLSLGYQGQIPNNNSPTIFETKIYNSRSPALFNPNKFLNKKAILSAPKLRSLTQTSWVAGGYWQTPLNSSSLSRSSSQSSGLGSLGSFGNSREPSVLDFDRCSVTSEKSQYEFLRPETPISGGNDIFKKMNDSSLLRQCTYTKNLVPYQLQGVPNYHGPITIVINPLWFSVLLCGSLLINTVVLCTILLR